MVTVAQVVLLGDAIGVTSRHDLIAEHAHHRRCVIILVLILLFVEEQGCLVGQ